MHTDQELEEIVRGVVKTLAPTIEVLEEIKMPFRCEDSMGAVISVHGSDAAVLESSSGSQGVTFVPCLTGGPDAAARDKKERLRCYGRRLNTRAKSKLSKAYTRRSKT